MINQEPNGQIMMTYRCSAACRHCLVMAAPDQDPLLVTIEDAVRYAEEFRQLDRHVMIAGGEALLFFEHLLEMCRAISDKGIPVAFIESNGSWCTSDEIVTERLSLRRDAGVGGMFFSIDPYHQEFLPAERVCRGVREAIRLFGPWTGAGFCAANHRRRGRRFRDGRTRPAAPARLRARTAPVLPRTRG